MVDYGITAPVASALGATPMIAPDVVAAPGVPGMPMGGMEGQGIGRPVPQYGFRPSFVS